MAPPGSPGPGSPLRLFANPAAETGPYPEHLRAILSLERHAEARREIASWPGYAPTPLLELAALARRAGVGRLWYKDEGPRFGLGSFKALGGPYGVLRILAREVARRTGLPEPGSRELLEGRHRALTEEITMTCASTGNHGRSVAWGCRTLGCRCVIFVPEWVTPGRAAAIASHGARVERVAGGYDESLLRARETAAERGWFVISDKSEAERSRPGGDAGETGQAAVPTPPSAGSVAGDIARDVMRGYTVLAAEALEQLAGEARGGATGEASEQSPADASGQTSEAPADVPTHVFVQAGVGGLAAALTAHLWESLEEARPRMVVVEAEGAPCLLESARSGRPVRLEGPLETMMGGLACREPSGVAWEILRPGAHWFLTVADEASAEAMRTLARPQGGDPPVEAGESGAAAVAGLLAAASDPAARGALDLDADARVLVIGTEGATDPEVYERIVGARVKRGA